MSLQGYLFIYLFNTCYGLTTY